MFYTVYVLRDRFNRIYIGQTQNLKKRLQDHEANKTKSLRNRGPFEVVYTEIHNNRIEAMKREKSLKSGQGRAWLKQKVGRASA